MRAYDVIVIGAGAGGLAAARLAAKSGAKVALIEKHKIGGGFLHSCIPSKTLLNVAKRIYEARQSQNLGIKVSKNIAWNEIISILQDAIQTVEIRSDSKEVLQKEGIDVIRGEARFVSRNTLSIDKQNEVSSKKIIIATGSRPVIPKIRGLSRVTYRTTDSIFSLAKLPSKIAIIGADPVGCEMASAFAMLGVSVTLIEKQAHLLPGFDKAVSRFTAESLERLGVSIRLGCAIERIVRYPRSLELRLKSKAEKDKIRVGELLFATGREANLNLDLSRGHIAFTKGGITVNRHQQTTNKHVYAIGDVTSRPKLAHVAVNSALVATRHALLGWRAKKNGLIAPPQFLYINPELVVFGLNEQRLKRTKRPYMTLSRSREGIDKPVTKLSKPGQVTIYVSPRGRLLGGFIAGKNASEVVGAFIMAMQNRTNIRHMGDIVFPYLSITAVVNELVADYVEHRPVRFNGTLKRVIKLRLRNNGRK